MPPGQQKGDGVSWDSPCIIGVWYLDFSKIAAPLYAVLIKLTNAHFEKTPRHLKTLDRSASIFVHFVHRWSANVKIILKS